MPTNHANTVEIVTRGLRPKSGVLFEVGAAAAFAGLVLAFIL